MIPEGRISHENKYHGRMTTREAVNRPVENPAFTIQYHITGRSSQFEQEKIRYQDPNVPVHSMRSISPALCACGNNEILAQEEEIPQILYADIAAPALSATGKNPFIQYEGRISNHAMHVRDRYRITDARSHGVQLYAVGTVRQ